MRHLIPVLFLGVLVAAPEANSAPQFPIDFRGEMCDGGTGVCTPTMWTMEKNGNCTMNGIQGYYTWDGSTQTFTAGFSDFIGTSMLGTKDPGAPCVSGDWQTIIPDIDGTFWFCKV